MYHTNTLAYQLGCRPLSVARDISGTSAVSTARAVDKFRNNHKANARPEIEAIWFYLMNHAVGEVRRRVEWHEPLGDYAIFLDEYNERGADMAARLFNYLVLICIRESRHAEVGLDVSQAVAKKYGTVVEEFNKIVRSTEDPLPHFSKNPPKTTLGAFVGSLRMIFFKGHFGQAYGGPKWGAVADALCKFVDGTFSAEMLLDVGWTLCHNGGPIFNKGMLYAGYNEGLLTTILDTQASGQIPQLVNADTVGMGAVVTASMKQFVKRMAKTLGAGFVADVNWSLVAAHSVTEKSYGGMMTKAQQEEANKIKAEVAAQIIASKEAEAAQKAKTHFMIMPNLSVLKLTRQDLEEAA